MVTAYVEPEGLLPGSMRPDLVITSLGDAERDVVIDVTVTSPFSVKRTAVVPLTAAKKMEVSKRKKYLEICRDAGLLFCPFAIEAYGATTDVATGYVLDPLIKESNGLPQSTGLLAHSKLTDTRDYHSHYGQQVQEWQNTSN